MNQDSVDAAIADGVIEFNAGRFWEAHERWERLWLRLEGTDKVALQGLIQLAAAYYHVRRQNLRGAARLFEKACLKLEATPDLFPGLEREAALATARIHRKEVETALQNGGSFELSANQFPTLSVRRSLPHDSG